MRNASIQLGLGAFFLFSTKKFYSNSHKMIKFYCLAEKYGYGISNPCYGWSQIFEIIGILKKFNLNHVPDTEIPLYTAISHTINLTRFNDFGPDRR